MRDSGGLRSAACPPSNRLFCVGLSLHELKRKKTPAVCECVLYLKHDKIFGCQDKSLVTRYCG